MTPRPVAAACELPGATIDRWRVSAALSGWSACVWADVAAADADAAHDGDDTAACPTSQGGQAGQAGPGTVAVDSYPFVMDGAMAGGSFDDAMGGSCAAIFADFGPCAGGVPGGLAGGPLLKDSRGHEKVCPSTARSACA